MSEHATLWVLFGILVTALLAYDIGVVERRSGTLSFGQACRRSAALVGIALLFGLAILRYLGPERALEYYAGYLIELSLSVDNLFVFILIFQYFHVPAAHQPRVLRWGILGAMVMRGLMIAAGVLLLQRFEWIIFIFGAILVATAIRLFGAHSGFDPERNLAIRLARRLLPMTAGFEGRRFFVRTGRRLQVTPLLVVVLVVEWTDLVFAVDSIPAIFAVTRDPFVVYSSNVLAVLGLRALYFLLAGMLDRFHYLKPAIALILLFVGAKMLADPWVHVPVAWSLAVVVSTLAVAVTASCLRARRHGVSPASPEPGVGPATPSLDP